MHTTAEAVGSGRDRGAADSSSRHATTASAANRGGGSCSTGPASPRCRPRSRRCLSLRLRCCTPLLLLLLAAAAVGVLCCSAASASSSAASSSASSSASSAAGAVDVLTLSDEEVEAWHTGGPLDPHPQGEEGEESEEGEEEQPQLIAHRRLHELMSIGGEHDTEDNGRDDDEQRGGPDGTTDGTTDGDAAAAAALLHLDELPLDELDELDELEGGGGGGVGGGLNGTTSSRKLMSSILAGPLPGLHFIPRGFPSPSLSAGGLGLMARLGAFGPAGAAAAAAVPGGVGPAAAAAGVGLASYVVQGQDPVAIALRQLSIVAIQAYGTLKRLAKQLDAADAQAQLKREADALKDGSSPAQLDQVQREIRVLVVLRAALKDTQARLGVYVKFLTAATSASAGRRRRGGRAPGGGSARPRQRHCRTEAAAAGGREQRGRAVAPGDAGQAGRRRRGHGPGGGRAPGAHAGSGRGREQRRILQRAKRLSLGIGELAGPRY